MNDGPTDAQCDFAAQVCGFDPREPSAGVLAATEGIVYFEQDKYVLTPDDQQELARYAQNYLKSSATAEVQVDGYASVEGTDKDNRTLSDNRARVVLEFLAKHGIPKERIKTTGHGKTAEFSKDNLLQNRRVTIAPPMKVLESGGSSRGTPTSLRMRKDGEPPDVRLTDEDAKRIIDKPSTPAKPCTVPRADVEAALTDYLKKVMKVQRTKTVTITLGIRTVAHILAEGLGDADGKIATLLHDDSRGEEPGDLAHRIAALLPAEIPCANFDEFKKQAPGQISMPKAKSMLDSIYEKIVDPVVDKLASPLPDQARTKLRELAHDAVEKGSSAGLKAAAATLGLDPTGQDALVKAVEGAIKTKREQSESGK
jgi:hypothetical protein